MLTIAAGVAGAFLMGGITKMMRDFRSSVEDMQRPRERWERDQV